MTEHDFKATLFEKPGVETVLNTVATPELARKANPAGVFLIRKDSIEVRTNSDTKGFHPAAMGRLEFTHAFPEYGFLYCSWRMEMRIREIGEPYA